jgi:uncharacterized tellurite resistance protein B-like protein
VPFPSLSSARDRSARPRDALAPGRVTLDRLRKFIHEVSGLGEDTGAVFADDDYRLAAAALLVHVVNADGTTAASERAGLRTTIEAEFGLDARATAELLERAEESDREAIDFFRFTSVLKRALDDNGRQKIVEMMWDVAFADGAIDELEENTIWRVAELLGVSTRERVLLRRNVAATTTTGDASDEARKGPWSRSPPENP